MKKKILLLFLIGFSINSFAQTTRYWNGNSSNSDYLSESTNWWDGVQPNSGDNLEFNNTSNRHWANSNYSTGSYFGNIIIKEGAGTIKFLGDNTYAYKFENNSENELFEIANTTIGNRINSNIEINPVGTGGILVSGGFISLDNVNGSRTLHFFGANSAIINGEIKEINGSGNVFVHDSKVTLKSASTYTGTTTIGNAGTLELQADLSSAEIIVENGAKLVINGIDVDIQKLTINTGGIVEVAAGKQLTVNGDLTNNGTLNLLSDANGTATILTNGAVSAGTYKVNQYLSFNRSWYLSSPVLEYVTPIDNNSAIPASLKWFDETKGDPTGWTDAIDKKLAARNGYLLNPGTTSGASTITFTGTINNGDLPKNLTRSGVTKAGFNLIGNPYPSHIVWTEDIALSAKLLPSIWYRTAVYNSDLSKNVYSFITLNAAGGISIPLGNTPYIPPMQGFWVQVDPSSDGTETLTFTNAMRHHKDSNPFKAPAAKTALNQILRLQVTGNSITDESVIYFNDNATNGYDMYDSPKMMNGATSTVPDMYTTAGTEELVINGMNNIPYNTEIPLYFKANASTAGTFTLKASEISNFEANTTVYIKNNLTGDQQLISDGSDYTFNTADAIANPAFSLIIKAPGAVTGLANADSKVLVYANANRQITVTVPSVTENATVSVYNAVGQKLYSSKVTKATTVIDNAFAAGVYVVNVNNVSKKVIVK